MFLINKGEPCLICGKSFNPLNQVYVFNVFNTSKNAKGDVAEGF